MASSVDGSSDSSQTEENYRSSLALEKKISRQAVDEGHDADIPSGAGFILDEAGKRRRRQSFADRRRASLAIREEAAAAVAAAEKAGRDIEKDAGAVSDTDSEADDENVVWWDGDHDPENPYNWPRWRININIVLVSIETFLMPLASSIFVPGVPLLMEEFHSDNQMLASFVVSVYVLGFAAGPLFMAPLSELYGRLPMYHVGNIGFVCFVIACAKAPNMGALIAFRVLSGLFGACPIANGGGSIADMVPQERRATAMAGFTVGPLLGPIIGPVAGGFLANAEGWRWCFWLLAIIGAVLTVAMFAFASETYHPVILQRKVNRLRKETGNGLLRSKLDVGLSSSDYFKRSIIRPLKLLTRSPIVILVATYIGIVYGYMYLMFAAMTIIFEDYYSFSTETVGLTFIGLGVGSLLGVAVFSSTSDRYLQKQAAKADAAAEAAGKKKEGMKPEYRLQTVPYGAVLLPIGLFVFGWTAQKRVHWIAPIIGTGIAGCGNIVLFMALQMYLIDAFDRYAASALAANTVVRSVAGALLPLAGLPMYDKLGVGWGNSLLGFIATAAIPVAFVFIKWGEHLRKKFPVKNL